MRTTTYDDSSYLFVPAHEARKVAKALSSAADAVVLDLEDSVPDAQKDAARGSINEHVTTARRGEAPRIWVRVNADPADLEADLGAVEWAALEGVVVPKADDPVVLHRLAAHGARRLIPMIETAAGFGALQRLSEAAAVSRFAIGTLDLALDLNLPSTDPEDTELLWQLRGLLTLESRRYGMASPIDGVYSRLDDEAGLRRVCQRARQLGYVGKMVVHPRQLDVVHSVFEPDAAELNLARAIVDAYDRARTEGRGAVCVEGRLVDAPVAARARALLRRWSARR